MDKKDLIINHINNKKDYCVEFLRDLIRFNSQVIDQGINGMELKSQEYIRKKFESIGTDKIDYFEPENDSIKKYKYDFNPGHNYSDRPNVVGRFDFGGVGKTILLNGHIDTVPPAGGIESWKYNPWDPKIEGGRVYGLGSVDMKGGLAASILAVEFLKELEILKKGSVIVESVVDEEGGGNGTLACVDRGYSADIAVVAEPTNLEIHVAHRGVLLLEITVKGISVHVAVKWKGVNAAEKAIKIIQGLSELEKIWLATKINKWVPSPTITLGVIKSGIGATIVPDECILKYDIKMTADDLDEEMGPSKIRNEVESWINRISEGDEWLAKNKPSLKWYLNVSPYSIKDEDLLKFNALMKKTEKILGQCKVSGFPCGCDARLIGNYGKIPTIIFGPGVLFTDSMGNKGAHAIDESINIDQYMDYVKILCLSIYDFINES